MVSHLSDHRKGLLLTTIGGLALSMDIPLIRLSSGDVWSVLSARSLATIFVALAALIVIRRVAGSLRNALPGWIGLPVGLFYGLTTITFLLAIYYTTAANVVFIIALNPMFAALLSWIFLKERPAPSTIVTMVAMIFGVGLIVWGGMEGGHFLGDALSVLASFSIACAITISRASRRDMGFASLLSAIIPAAVGLYHVIPSSIAIDHPGWILLDGAVLMPPLLLVPCHRHTLSLGAGSGDVLSAGNDPGADMGLADLCRSAKRHDARRRTGADPGAGDAFAMAGAGQGENGGGGVASSILRQPI